VGEKHNGEEFLVIKKILNNDVVNIKTTAVEGGRECEVVTLHFPKMKVVEGMTRKEQWEKVLEELAEVKVELEAADGSILANECFDLIQAILGLMNNKTTRIDLKKANKTHIKKLI